MKHELDPRLEVLLKPKKKIQKHRGRGDSHARRCPCGNRITRFSRLGLCQSCVAPLNNRNNKHKKVDKARILRLKLL